MRIPDAVKIGPHSVPVVYQRDLRDDQGAELFGEYTDDPPTIRLHTCLKRRPAQRLAVYLHEVLHALNDIWAMRLTHNQINQLANAFTEIIRGTTRNGS